jgi:hypothetical protein
MNDEDKELLVKIVVFCAAVITVFIFAILFSYAEAYIWLTMYKKIILDASH